MTAAELVKSALRLTGGLAAGQEPNTDEAADGLEVLITLLDSWAGQELILFSTALRTVTLSTTNGPYTIPTDRPIKVFGADVLLANGLQFGLQVLGPQAFMAMPHEDPSPHTKAVMCDYASPDAHVYVNPTPTGSSTLRLHCAVSIVNVDDGDTEIALPPGYLKALRYNLAEDFCAEYGHPCPPEVLRIAASTKANIAALNGSNRAGASQVEIPALPAEVSQ